MKKEKISEVAKGRAEDAERESKKGSSKWKNRERVLVFCSRGVSFRDRHLMRDFRTLLAHSKAESKMDKSESLQVINEIADMANASKCLYFECRKKKDLYLWAAATPRGPSAKFLVHNVHTMAELRLTGNCLVGSRPLLSFSPDFNRVPHLMLLKELFIQIFGTPAHHPKSQPFLDHVFNFATSPDGQIWFRNYQIVEESGQLEEIGPRMVLEVIKIFDRAFGGEILYENAAYVNPNDARRQAKLASASNYIQRVEAKKSLEHREALEPILNRTDPLDDLFQTDRSKLPTKRKTSENEDESDDDGPTLDPQAAQLEAEIERKKRRGRKKGGKKRKMTS